MSIKKIVIIIGIVLSISAGFTIFAFCYKVKTQVDVAAVNDIAQSLAEGWDRFKYMELPCLNYKMDYVVLDNENGFIRATRKGLNSEIGAALRNRDTIVDIRSGDVLLGRLIVYNDTYNAWQRYKNYLLKSCLGIIVLVAVLCVIYLTYIDRNVLQPFRKLQSFARHVAEGNLDAPLEMDKGNLFGAFTESFDLMREELNRARENERLANQSKKELVASLSHDIKTPIASIKAVTEVLHIKSSDESQRKQLEIINSKADQINTLITNMFNATLEELHELKVSVTEESSQSLYNLIRNGDYNNKADIGNIPECIIMIDILRLTQIIDNIISNSYKYAGTSINVTAQIKDEFLEVAFKDYGLGVPIDELPLIFNKFYRGKNSSGKGGTGLGLYISKYLIEKMGGCIYSEKSEDGFSVVLKILIA